MELHSLSFDNYLTKRFGLSTISELPQSIEKIRKARTREMEKLDVQGKNEITHEVAEYVADLTDSQRKQLSELGLTFKERINLPKHIYSVNSLKIWGVTALGYSGTDSIYVLENGVNNQPFVGKFRPLKKIWQARLIAHELKHFWPPHFVEENGQIQHPATSTLEEGIAQSWDNANWNVIQANFPSESEMYQSIIAISGHKIDTHMIKGCWQFSDGTIVDKIPYPKSTLLVTKLRTLDDNFDVSVETARFNGNTNSLKENLSSINPKLHDILTKSDSISAEDTANKALQQLTSS